ncbi:MAG: hypothetical protein GXX95_06315 [Methanomassiliicoccus sp.]|jgi:hypothetical protein|nr:hypothetical protein [Methanomassiliicoccus sp.]
MKKNTLLVLAVIIIPIVIMGSLAMAGASNYPQNEETHEGDTSGENTTEGAAIIVLVEQISSPAPLMSDAVDLERITL